jgi:hypothetical protein
MTRPPVGRWGSSLDTWPHRASGALVVLGAAAVLAAGCGIRSCGPPRVASTDGVTASARFVFTRAETQSTEFPHGSATRSGRVAVGPRAGGVLTAVGPIQDGPRPDDPPRFLELPASAPWLVIERPGAHEGTFEVRSRAAANLSFARQTSSSGSHVLACDQGYVLRDVPLPWSGVDGDEGLALNQRGELLALARNAGTVRALIVSPDGQTNHQGTRPDFTRVEASRVSAGAKDARRAWGMKLDEPGVGAIDGSGQAVVVLPSGRLLVLAPDGNGRGEGVVKLDAPIDANATDVSIIPPHVLVLYGGGDAGPLAADRTKTYGRSRLDARDANGALSWRAELPFIASQPPLDGDGRIYVVGNGIVALDPSGAVLWSHLEAATLHAATFADGTLVVVGGGSIRVVAPDGSVLRSVRVPEPLTSYPAIDARGDVWVASAKTLYVLR